MAALRMAFLVALASILFAPAAFADGAGAGKSAFATTCAMCHSVDGSTIVGPTLRGVIGRKAGSVSGFAYSDALKSAKITWTPAEVDAFITNPQKRFPGTRMPISVGDPAKRAAIIAYLKTLH